MTTKSKCPILKTIIIAVLVFLAAVFLYKSGIYLGGKFFDVDNFTGTKLLKYEDGSFYNGEFLNGQRHGQGEMYFSDDEDETMLYYRGGWVDDTFSGKGFLEFRDGSNYTGNFLDGFQHGRGKFMFQNDSDETSLEGRWFRDKISGLGVLLGKHGQRFKGQFWHGSVKGDGTYFYPQSSPYEKYFAKFKNNQHIGDVVLFWKNGTRCKAQLDDDHEPVSFQTEESAPLNSTSATTIGLVISSSVSTKTLSPSTLLSGPTNYPCGIPHVLSRKKRIVNGTQSSQGQFPWQVSIQEKSFFGSNYSHVCGGSIINDFWVLSAAHCFSGQLIKNKVRLGAWDLSSTSKLESYSELKVVQIISHPKYNKTSNEYDIALLKLERRIPFQEHILPICIAANDEDLAGKIGTISGWGNVDSEDQESYPSILRHAKVLILSNKECEDMLEIADMSTDIYKTFVCAGGGHKDTCQGDSGGPLAVKDDDGRYFLAGVSSWGYGCGTLNQPGVYTRVSKMKLWIQQHTSESPSFFDIL